MNRVAALPSHHWAIEPEQDLRDEHGVGRKTTDAMFHVAVKHESHRHQLSDILAPHLVCALFQLLQMEASKMHVLPPMPSMHDLLQEAEFHEQW
jgi:hypothetical protein